MSQGFATRLKPAAGTYGLLYRNDADKHATVVIRLTNQDLNNPAQIRLAICPADYIDGAAPAAADHIEAPDFGLLGGQLLEQTGQPIAPGECVVMFSNTGAVSGRCAGFKSTDIAE